MQKRLNLVLAGGLLAVVALVGCSSTPDPMATPEDQMIALDGGDLPLAPMDIDATFGEPMPEDALILQDIHFDYDQS